LTIDDAGYGPGALLDSSGPTPFPRISAGNAGHRYGLAFGPEEVPHQRDAIVGQNPFYEFGLWVERPGGWRLAEAPAITVLFVFRPKYDTADLAPVEGAGAHEAGFYGHVEGCFGKILASQVVECGGEGNDLGVCGAIIEPFGLVVTAGDDPAGHDHYGTDRHLVLFKSYSRLFESLLHKVFVVPGFVIHGGTNIRLYYLHLCNPWIDDQAVVLEI